MNLNRSSKVTVALLALLLAAAIPAAAVTVSGDAPGSVQVGEKQQTTFTFEKPFENYDEWTLKGQTGLTQVTWKVTTYDNTDKVITEQTYTGQSFQHHLKSSSGAVRVEVQLVGTPGSVENWSYQPAQQITYASFIQAQEGGASSVIKAYETRPYTQQSQQARTAIDQAKAAIENAEAAGASVEGAKSDLQDAIEFYNNGNFQQAIKNANEAEQKAQSAAQSAQQTDLLIKVGAGVVVLLLIAGGVYWYLQQRETYDKLG